MGLRYETTGVNFAPVHAVALPNDAIMPHGHQGAPQYFMTLGENQGISDFPTARMKDNMVMETECKYALQSLTDWETEICH